MTKFPCTGVIIFSKIWDDIKTVLVQTHRGYYSFPKGKLEKGEKDFDGAIRELKEETGIDYKILTFIKDVELEELSVKGNPSVKYYIAILEEEYNNFVFDEDELKNVEWFTIENALELDGLRKGRKETLKKAYELYLKFIKKLIY